MNTRFRTVIVAGVCALAFGLSACGDNDVPTTPALPDTSASTNDAPPPAQTDLSVFEGRWGHQPKGATYDTRILTCDAEANCRMSVEGSSSGSLIGPITVSAENTYSLSMSTENGERKQTYTVSVNPNGNSLEAVTEDGDTLVFAKREN